MSGTNETSNENSEREVEIPLDEPVEELVIGTPKPRDPEYFECTDNYTTFDNPITY